MKIRIEIALVLLIALSPFAVRGEEPSTEPILRIETGMHTAPVTTLATDSTGRFLVTGSFDKTVRVWDLASSTLVRTLRPPIGQQKEGTIFSVAMSPDGKLVAASGMTGYEWVQKMTIYLFDQGTGKLIRSIGEFPSVVVDLEFSPDGRSIAAALAGSWNGVQVFRVGDGQIIARDNSYGAACGGLGWDHSGRLVTSSWDGYFRLYGKDLKLETKTKASGGGKPISITFSPDGDRIAVGYQDAAKVDVISASDLRSLYRPDTAGVPNTNLPTVAWSSDGQFLSATGLNLSSGKGLVRRWSEAGHGDFRDLSTGTLNTVTGISTLPGGRLVFATAEPSWGVLSPSGEPTLLVTSGAPDLRDPEGLSVDSTGGKIRFGYQYEESGAKSFATYSIPDHALVLDTPKASGLARPRIEAPGLSISGWKSSYTPPILAGKPLALASGELTRSLAIASDGRSFLLGTDMSVYSFASNGKKRWRILPQDGVWAVNFSGDGRLAIATLHDGTIHWFRADNGNELLAFFPHADRKRWVAWTPSGYYDASVGGEDLIGWHVNRGPDQAADFFPVSHFRDRFYRPDVVARVLDTLDETLALDQANSEAQRKKEATDFAKLLPPVVTILAPANESEVQEASVLFRFTVRSPSGEPVTAVHAYVDGRPAASARGSLTYVPDPQPADSAADPTRTITVPIPPRDSTVAIFAETQFSTSEPVVVKLHWAPPPQPWAKPKLYLLAVGIGNYKNPAFKLNMPAKDVRDVVVSWKAQAGSLYSEVDAKALTDDQATKDGILDGLEWLERQATAQDVAVLYFSGHGMNDPRDGEYLFLPYEGDLDSRLRTMLPSQAIRGVLSSIPGKVLLFLDTCHSGNLFGKTKSPDAADLTGLINELTRAENGVIVFSASTGRQSAIESDELKNGAFTLALVEALTGKADLDGDHSMYITEIENYLARRVKELTHGLQTPVVAKPGGMPDFPVAVMVSPK